MTTVMRQRGAQVVPFHYGGVGIRCGLTDFNRERKCSTIKVALLRYFENFKTKHYGLQDY